MGIPETEETVGGKEERVKDGVRFGPGPCPILPGQWPRKGLTERAVATGQPSVPFVSDGREEGDRRIDLISLEHST